MSQVAPDILSQAIARNSAAVLSLPSAGMFRHHKSRFLNETPDGVWIEAVLTERPLIEGLIADGQPCGISFKSADQKVSFTGKILKLDPEFQMNDTTVLPAVMVTRPEQVKAVQRRNNYRVRVPADAELTVRVWRVAEHFRLKDKPPRGAELSLQLRDISVGGLGVTLLPQDGQPPKILAGERVRVAVSKADAQEFVVEGRVRTLRNADNQSICTGIQFLKLQDGIEGRLVLAELTKIVGGLQLDEVRRKRLGIAN